MTRYPKHAQEWKTFTFKFKKLERLILLLFIVEAYYFKYT